MRSRLYQGDNRAEARCIVSKMAKIAYILLCHKDPEAIIQRFTGSNSYAIRLKGSTNQSAETVEEYFPAGFES